MRKIDLLRLTVYLNENNEIDTMSAQVNSSIKDLAHALSLLLLSKDAMFKESLLIATRVVADTIIDDDIQEILNSLNIKRE